LNFTYVTFCALVCQLYFEVDVMFSHPMSAT